MRVPTTFVVLGSLGASARVDSGLCAMASGEGAVQYSCWPAAAALLSSQTLLLQAVGAPRAHVHTLGKKV